MAETNFADRLFKSHENDFGTQVWKNTDIAAEALLESKKHTELLQKNIDKINDSYGGLYSDSQNIQEVVSKTIESQYLHQQKLNNTLPSNVYESQQNLTNTIQHFYNNNSGLYEQLSADQSNHNFQLVDIGNTLNNIYTEGQLTRETLSHSVELLSNAFVYGVSELKEDMKEELHDINNTLHNDSQMTHDLILQSSHYIGDTIQQGITILEKKIDHGVQSINDSLSDMGDIFVYGLNQVDDTCREGFFEIQEALCNEGEATRDLMTELFQISTKIFIKGFQSLVYGFEKINVRIETANILIAQLLQESMNTNKTLEEIECDVSNLIHVTLKGNKELVFQLKKLMNAMYVQNTQNHQMQKDIIEELSTKNQQYTRLFETAEKFKNAKKYKQAIDIYTEIIKPQACPNHYFSYISLAECFFIQGEFEMAFNASEYAYIIADDSKIKEQAFIFGVMIRYYEYLNAEHQDDIIYIFLNYIETHYVIDALSSKSQLFIASMFYILGLKTKAIKRISQIIDQDSDIILHMNNPILCQSFCDSEILDLLVEKYIDTNKIFSSRIDVYLIEIFQNTQDVNVFFKLLQRAFRESLQQIFYIQFMNLPILKKYPKIIESAYNEVLPEVISKKYHGGGLSLLCYYYISVEYNFDKKDELLKMVLCDIQSRPLSQKILDHYEKYLGKYFKDFYSLYVKYNNI
jgi:hypothetical protein